MPSDREGNDSAERSRQKKDWLSWGEIGSIGAVTHHQQKQIEDQSKTTHEEEGEGTAMTRQDNALMNWYADNPQELQAYDDVSGAPLKLELATKARRTYIEFFRKLVSTKKVPRALALAKQKTRDRSEMD